MRFLKLVPIFLVALLLSSCAGKQEKPLETAKVARGNISAGISCVGVVTPRSRIEIKSAVAGRIENILVNEGDNVKKGQELALVSSSDRAALLDAARAKGAEEVKYWEDVYKASPVIAPLDGFIIVRTMQPGQSIDLSTPVLVMADKLIVQSQVDETDLSRVKLGQNADIALDAYQDQKIPGKVEHIAYESQVVNNVTIYQVNVLPFKVPPYFRSGMSANVNFFLSEKKNALILPVNAVKKIRGNSSVFVKAEEKKAPAVKMVTTGLEDDKYIEIISGLKEGDEVLIPSAKMVQDAQSGHGGFRPPGILGGRR